MRVFLSYATQQRPVAEQVRQALLQDGHAVFFDLADLAPGGNYHAGIRGAIARSHVLVFLVSGDSITAGTYALTELELAAGLGRRGPALLPVMVERVDYGTLPPVLSEITILEPAGDVPAEVAAQVDGLRRRRRRRLVGTGGLVAGLAAAALAVGLGAPVEDLARRLARIVADSAVRVPEPERVRLIGMATNQGWVVTFDIAEHHVREIRYQLDGAGEWTSTGFQSVRDRETGLPLPTYQLLLPGASGEREIAVRYTDVGGRDHGPYRLRFDPKAAFVTEVKQILQMTEWLSFREYPAGHRLAYFTHLVSYKNAFTDIRYSVDDDSLSRRLRFTPDWSRGAVPGISDDDETHVELPPTAKSVAVQLRYIDGTASELRRFAITEDAIER
jgi:hypothetical protein